MIRMNSTPEQNLPDIVIRSEEEAYEVLRQARDGELGPYNSLVFDGWPTLNLYLKGEKFHQSITPTVMKGLLEFQKGIYRSYAAAKYDHPTKRLSEQERDDLEIRVDVNDGSSDLEINFQEIATKLFEQMVGKMDSQDIVITIVTIAVLYFGTSAYRSFLENRKEIRIKEVSDETQRDTLSALKYTSEQETKRAQIIADLARDNAKVENITQIAFDAQTEVVKAMAAGNSSKVDGISLAPGVAETLTQNARRQSEEVRLDGIYRLIKLDWTDSSKFKVKVFNTESGIHLDAEVQDDSLTGKYKEALREAEWSRSPVALKINAKTYGDDSYRNAVVISAEKYVPPDVTQ